MTKLLLSLLFSLLISFTVQAENSTPVNGYTIHHNALTTDILPAKVTKAYGIPRSKSRALINISIIKDKAGTIGTAVTAEVSLIARNLFGQIRDFELTEIREENAIYYITDFAVADREQLVFEIDAKPIDSIYGLKAKFQHEFYTK